MKTTRLKTKQTTLRIPLSRWECLSDLLEMHTGIPKNLSDNMKLNIAINVLISKLESASKQEAA